MTWWQLTPALLWTAAITFLPGYVVVRSWGVAGLVAAGTAAPVSVALIGSVAVLAPLVGLPWGVWPVLGAAAVLAALGLVLRVVAPGILGLRDRPRRRLRSRWTLLVHLGALVIPAVLLMRGLIAMIGRPLDISQTWDNIFHLNAIRYILDTGTASSLQLGGMYSNGADPSPYPAAWHDLVSLVVSLSGVSIPAAVNAVTLVVGALVWPVSAIFLTTRVTGNRPVPVLFAGALSAVFGSFPYLMVDFGVLYPMFLSLALLPAALALLAMTIGVGGREHTPRWVSALLLVATVGGIALAHPSTFQVLLVFVLPILATALVRYRRALTRGWAGVARFSVLALLFAGYLALVAVLWIRVRPSEEASTWLPIQSMSQAIGQVLSAGLMREGPSWVVLVLTLVAVALVVQRRLNVWVVGVYLIAAALFVISSSAPDGPIRDFITGVWYNDSFRLAGQLPVIIVVVCTIAAVWWFGRVQSGLSTRYRALGWLRPGPVATPAVAAVAFVAAIALGVAGQFSSVNSAIGQGSLKYAMTPESQVLSPDERALLRRLDDSVPRNARIIGNPWTGTSLAYAYSGRRTLTPHVGGTIPPDVLKLMNKLHRIDDNPEICALVRDMRAYYVLDFDGPQVHDKNRHYPGLMWLSDNSGLTEIDHEGSATLYRVTGCGPRR
ncbi:hypothetical protein B0I33_105351 [Prauserella shujinwangii]|uniref:4-amino-4-deoxy-L-arabinose transferase-like glycosyltransferase n=1 Tax=Prauserella shujinwangii TaxID=1453103 RepID=A0A2T0LVH4_9PSEU|nr:DUF6541 family protein [Prauserella shujinwangii]PRX47769.1 hypothetical protein B0I33_105351 [Prauserella shujinwangii]